MVTELLLGWKYQIEVNVLTETEKELADRLAAYTRLREYGYTDAILNMYDKAILQGETARLSFISCVCILKWKKTSSSK